jgi:hypothetical protein
MSGPSLNLFEIHQIKFALPPPDTSSESSNSSEERNPANEITFHLPSPSSSSSATGSKDSPCPEHTLVGGRSVCSKFSTLLCSNLSRLIFPPFGSKDKLSPIKSSVLPFRLADFNSESDCNSSTSIQVPRVPKGYPIMDDDNSGTSTIVADDDDATFPDYVESDVDVDGGTVVSSSRSPDQIVPVAEFNITDLARSLLDDSSDLHISAEEAILIANSSVNTKKYEKNKKGVEARFFDTLEKYGGNELKKLTSYANDGFRCERLFYIMLRGEKTEEKRFVLNKCLVKIALKWRNMKDKNKGEHLQPSTWETLMKYLFAVFRQKNIRYNYATDFNGDGTVCGNNL